MTRDRGRELELPNTCGADQHSLTVRDIIGLTAIAVTKFLCGSFFILTIFVHRSAESHDMTVCTKRMTGMIHSSLSLSAVSCEDSLLKTCRCQSAAYISFGGR